MNDLEGLDIPQVERLIQVEVQNAVSYIYGSDYVAAERERNLDYYNGVMYDLPSAKGRSKYVDKTMKTHIDMMLPSLSRIFFSGQDVGRYTSSSRKIGDTVKAVNRYINDVVFRKDNNGELVLNGAFKDALLQKAGIVKAWWQKSEETEDQTFDDLPDDQFAMKMVEALATGLEPVGYSGPLTESGDMHSVVLRKRTNTSCPKIAAIPPDEWIISRDARDLEDAVLKAHRYAEKVGTLIERGYDADIIRELGDYSDTTTKRQSDAQSNTRVRNKVEDPSLREVAVYEGVVICNKDGEGLKPYFFVAGGSQSKIKILEIEPYRCQVVFADLIGDYDPHSFWSQCVGDDLAQLQRVNTVLVRQILDVGYLSATPQREVVADWIIKPDQLMNFAPGAPILVKQPGAIRELSVPYTGLEHLQVLQYFEQRAQERSGANKQMAGLDPEALSNQSATAANLAYQASMGRLEHIARMFSIGVRKLFRGLLKIVSEYQDYERIVMLDNEPTPIDPKAWKEFGDLDVTINTGLGSGNRDRDATLLFQNITLQSQMLKEVGPNPAVNFNTLMDSYDLWLEALGVTNPRQISGKLPPGWAPEPPKPQGPEFAAPDTKANAMAIVEAEKVKAETSQANKLIDAQNDAVKEANRHLETMLGLQNDATKIQAAAAEAVGTLNLKERELQQSLERDSKAA